MAGVEELSLDDARGRFIAAKQILGFANRSPSDAARTVGGQGFLVIGLEPGKLIGTPRRDPAQLEDALRPFLGLDGPVWDADYVTIDGIDVLIVIVAPPAVGQPIYTLRKTYGSSDEGSIFVRHKAKTDPATSTDVAALTSRATTGTGGSHIYVEVGWATDPSIAPMHFTDDAVDEYIDSDLEELTAAPVGLGQLVPGIGEGRSLETYQKEIAKYADKLRSQTPMLAFREAIRRGLVGCVPRVTNPTDHNFRDLELVLTFEDEVFPFDENELGAVSRVKRPRPWGTAPAFSPSYNFPSVSELGPLSLHGSAMLSVARDEPPSVVTYPPFDLRPRGTEDLRPVHLLVYETSNIESVSVRWSATSTSVSGVATGILIARVEEPSPSVLQLLAGVPVEHES